MAKILCAKSGIQFSCDHVPMFLHSKEVSHPIFYLPKKKLLGLYAKWATQELTDTDSYLLYLALFNSTELVDFRIPAELQANTKQIIANNMKQLVSVVSKIDNFLHPSLNAARISINSETKTLSTSHIWIEIWEQNFADFQDGYKTFDAIANIQRREKILERLIKSQDRNPERYASILSKWAADAGNFPTFQVKHPITYLNVTCSEYWQDIIRMCVLDSRIFNIPKADIEELIEHCDEFIAAGSIYQHALMELMKSGVHKHSTFLGFGDIDISKSNYRIIPDDSDVEKANIIAMIESAPTIEPKEKDYPSKIAYLRAKFRWEAAQRYAGAQEVEVSESAEQKESI